MQTEKNFPGSTSNGDKQETIKELADRHLADPSHKTSDEELRNARIVLDESTHVEDESLYEIDNTTLIPPLPFEKPDEEAEQHIKDEVTPPNPYDVLK